MALPKQEQLIMPFLEAISDQEEHHVSWIREKISKKLQISKNERNLQNKSGDFKIRNRVGWAATILNHSRLVEITKRATYKITARGIKALKDKPDDIIKYLEQYAEYLAFRKQKISKKKNYNQSDENKDRDFGSDTLWSEDDITLTLYTYKLTPINKQVSSNPEIKKLSKLINHTPDSIIDKLSSFSNTDSPLSKNSVESASLQDKKICNKYSSNNELLFSDTKKIIKRLKKTKNIDEYPKILNDIDVGDTEKTVNVKMRKHQQQFRALILSIYDYKCCITGLRTLDLLEAAHIAGWSEYKEYRLKGNNGLCINSLFHDAYDKYLVSITPDYIFKVNRNLIKYDDPFVLEIFIHYHGKRIYLPDERYKPDKDLLAIHYEKFNGK